MAQREWTISIVAEGSTPDPESLAAGLAERLKSGVGGAVSVEPGRVAATFTVFADGLDKACYMAFSIWNELRSEIEVELVGLQVDTAEEIVRAVERHLAPLDLVDNEELAQLLADSAEEPAPDVEPPVLLGTAEVAQTLEVSKARVSALQHRTTFPKPLARLRSGPVWSRAAIENYLTQHRYPASPTEGLQRAIEPAAWLGQSSPPMQH
jgi:predicted DNA-binding transcriptional regulator AlpA